MSLKNVAILLAVCALIGGPAVPFLFVECYLFWEWGYPLHLLEQKA